MDWCVNERFKLYLYARTSELHTESQNQFSSKLSATASEFLCVYADNVALLPPVNTFRAIALPLAINPSICQSISQSVISNEMLLLSMK
jgi:hypothetical protein